jgi:hypothetical protein
MQRAEAADAEGDQAEHDLDDDRQEGQPGPLDGAGKLGEERHDQQDQAEQRHDIEADDAVDGVANVAVVVRVDDHVRLFRVGDHHEPAHGNGGRLDQYAQGNQPSDHAVCLPHELPLNRR